MPAKAADEQWRGYVNQLIYGAPLAEIPTQDIINRLTEAVLAQRHFRQPVAAYHGAANAAIASNEKLSGSDPRHNEAAIRALLRGFVDELDRRVPWPEPPFTVLGSEEWPNMEGYKPIGTIDRLVYDVQNRLGRAFEAVAPSSDIGMIFLRLRSGGLVGLVAPVSPSATGTTIRAKDDLVDELSEATGFTVDRYLRATDC